MKKHRVEGLAWLVVSIGYLANLIFNQNLNSLHPTFLILYFGLGMVVATVMWDEGN